MYKKLAVVLIVIGTILFIGTGIGSDGSAGMFIKIGLGLMVLAIASTGLIALSKNRKKK